MINLRSLIFRNLPSKTFVVETEKAFGPWCQRSWSLDDHARLALAVSFYHERGSVPNSKTTQKDEASEAPALSPSPLEVQFYNG